MSPEPDEHGVSLTQGITLAIQMQASSSQSQSNWPPPKSGDDPRETPFPDK